MRRSAFTGGVLALGLALGLTLGGTGWLVTDALEANNDFCNACHLREGPPLHVAHRRDFDARPPINLAALHATAQVASRPSEPDFRCIDCHGGVGVAGRTRVKVLAAVDSFWWAVRHFEEPEGMAWPLRDEDCAQCHPSFEGRVGGDLERPDFHDLAVHNVGLSVRCVECHTAHDSRGTSATRFLETNQVRKQCARCHIEFQEGRS